METHKYIYFLAPTSPSDQESTNLISQSRHALSVDTTDLPPSSSPSTNAARHSVCCAEYSSQLSNSTSTALSHLRFQNRIDVDCETESNHDTALTLACAGGHEELVLLLLQRNAYIEHRDKKGFTPLILAGKSDFFISITTNHSCFFSSIFSDCGSCKYCVTID